MAPLKESAMRNIGILLIGMASCVMAAAYYQKVHEDLPLESEYQLVQLAGSAPQYQYLLDKTEGRVWQITCSGTMNGYDCDGVMTWSEMYIENLSPQDSPSEMIYHAMGQMPLRKTAKNLW